MSPVRLPGESVVMDSSWFVGTGDFRGSVKFDAAEVPHKALVRVDEDTLRFETRDLTAHQRQGGTHGVGPLRDRGQFAESPDEFTIIGYARVWKHLQSNDGTRQETVHGIEEARLRRGNHGD